MIRPYLRAIRLIKSGATTGTGHLARRPKPKVADSRPVVGSTKVSANWSRFRFMLAIWVAAVDRIALDLVFVGLVEAVVTRKEGRTCNPRPKGQRK